LRDSTLENNFVLSRGGAVAVHANATAVIEGCTFTDNTVRAQDGKGGALFLQGFTNLSSTALTGNTANVGGAILLVGRAKLLLGKNVSVTNNKALSNGGGVAVLNKTVTVEAVSVDRRGRYPGTDADFRALQAVATDNTAEYNPDLSVPIVKLEILDDISVFNLTSRLSASEGLIEVGVTAIGWFNLSPKNTEIEAFLGNLSLATNRTGDNGTAMFTTLKLQELPGIYNLTFRPKGQLEPTANLMVNVTGCPVGNVKADTDKACIQCPRGLYSFNPENTTCDTCPKDAGERCAGPFDM
jgi:hypothetical protein